MLCAYQPPSGIRPIFFTSTWTRSRERPARTGGAAAAPPHGPHRVPQARDTATHQNPVDRRRRQADPERAARRPASSDRVAGTQRPGRRPGAGRTRVGTTDPAGRPRRRPSIGMPLGQRCRGAVDKNDGAVSRSQFVPAHLVAADVNQPAGQRAPCTRLAKSLPGRRFGVRRHKQRAQRLCWSHGIPSERRGSGGAAGRRRSRRQGCSWSSVVSRCCRAVFMSRKPASVFLSKLRLNQTRMPVNDSLWTRRVRPSGRVRG
jgi:hypothetical protein